MNGAPAARIFGAMGLRLFLAILTGFALLFAPVGLQSGSAMAMAPEDHQLQMTQSGHCGERPVKDQHSKSPAMTCCAAMCTALAIPPMSSAHAPFAERMTARPGAEHSGPSFLAELPTPPPRLA